MIATSPAPVGGETTVVALDRAAAALGNFPALALGESGTLRPELLVGEAGTAAIRSVAGGGEFTAPEPEPEPEPEPAAPAKKPAARKRKPAAKKKPAPKK